MNTVKFRMLAELTNGTGFEVEENLPIKKALSDDELVELIREYYYFSMSHLIRGKPKVDPKNLKKWTAEIDYPFEWFIAGELEDGYPVMEVFAKDTKNHQHNWKTQHYFGIWQKLDTMAEIKQEKK